MSSEHTLNFQAPRVKQKLLREPLLRIREKGCQWHHVLNTPPWSLSSGGSGVKFVMVLSGRYLLFDVYGNSA